MSGLHREDPDGSPLTLGQLTLVAVLGFLVVFVPGCIALARIAGWSL